MRQEWEDVFHALDEVVDETPEQEGPCNDCESDRILVKESQSKGAGRWGGVGGSRVVEYGLSRNCPRSHFMGNFVSKTFQRKSLSRISRKQSLQMTLICTVATAQPRRSTEYCKILKNIDVENDSISQMYLPMGGR